MQRVTERYMFPNADAARDHANVMHAQYPIAYETHTTVEPNARLPRPYTHTLTVERWNSCD